MTRDQTGPHFPGSLRDYFAGQQVSRLGPMNNQNDDLQELPRTVARSRTKRLAEWCYEQADAMIAARDHERAKRSSPLAEAREDKTDE